jgi:hypothetical protein
VLILLAAAWTLWGACWLRRVELRREHDPMVRSLGLVWAREGLGPVVRAAGTVAGHRVEIRWRRLFDDGRVRVCVDGVVVALAEVEALGAASA